MKTLQDISGMNPKAQELLEAAGYSEVSALEELSLDEITDEVIKANHALEVLETDPTSSDVRQWLEPLKGDIGELVDPEEAEGDSNSVTSKDLLAASFAIPLSRAFIELNEVDVNQLLDGRVRYLSDDVTVKVADYVDDVIVEEEAEELVAVEAIAEKKSESEEKIELPIEELNGLLPEPIRKESKKESEIDTLFDSVAEPDGGTVHINKRDARINKDNILTMDAFRNEGSRVEPLKNKASHDLTRSTRRETNEGVNPNSKRFVRGVLHKRAGSFMFSLLAYLTFVLCIIAGFSLPLLALIDKEKFFWAMFSPLLIIVGILIYLMFTGRASCPICNQKQFAPKNCLKHRDAHHLPVIGYMLPTALHAMFFKWFKCIFCGTSVRLKE